MCPTRFQCPTPRPGEEHEIRTARTPHHWDRGRTDHPLQRRDHSAGDDAHGRGVRRARCCRGCLKYGVTRQRYYQVLKLCGENGALALQPQKRGPKTNYVRTDEVERQVIRQRFLDPDASADIIAQKLRQAGFQISTRSVERVIEKYGLQKKTLPLPPGI